MSWTSIQAVGTRVIAKLHRKRDKIGRIIIPDDFQRAQESCEIVSVGPRAPCELKPGQVLLIGKFNGVPIPAPEHDPEGEYVALDCDYRAPRPFTPDAYGLIEASESDDVTLAVSSDAPKRRTGT